MMNTDLKQTEFCIEKLQNVVNVGGSSAYQILTFPGPVIGRLCSVTIPETQSAANDGSVSVVKTVERSTSWIQRIRSAFLG